TPAPMGGTPPPALPANFGSGPRPVETIIAPARGQAPAPAPAPTAAATRPQTADELPELPAEIDLPPLPK
ncbi:MAG: hypothetical protein ACXWN0_13125, partial [Isosphaeraceae bacterium]